jgi:putative nucleotidyltransferase with HDIG domain
MSESVREKVMVVDDEESIRAVISRKLDRAGLDCVGLENGLRAILALQAGRYDAVIADVNMPHMGGTELLKWVKIRDPALQVIMISGLDDLDLVRKTMRDGAFDYLVKPLDYAVLESTVRRAIGHGQKARASRDHQQELRRLVDQRTLELQRALGEIEQTYDATILALGSALETRDTDTQTHGLRVARYSLLLARGLGMTDAKLLTDIERGAYLHDIGKIGVPDHILRKNGALTDEERAEMMRHPEIGRRMVMDIGFLKGAVPIVYSHHERTDGKGYPRGLAGEEIPVEARVFAVADALDAMISERPYRAPMPIQTARAIIAEETGKQFDPVVVSAAARLSDEDILATVRMTAEGQGDRGPGSASSRAVGSRGASCPLSQPPL